MATNTKKGAVAIQSLLGGSDGMLADFHKRAAKIQVFQEKIKAILPPPLCDHYILANIDKNTVTLHTDNSAWAARLRFKTPDILNCVQALCDVDPPQTIRIKVVPPVSQPAHPKRKLNLSSKNAQLIRDTAQSITDSALRDALIRLSQRKS